MIAALGEAKVEVDLQTQVGRKPAENRFREVLGVLVGQQLGRGLRQQLETERPALRRLLGLPESLLGRSSGGRVDDGTGQADRLPFGIVEAAAQAGDRADTSARPAEPESPAAVGRTLRAG